MKGKFVIYNWQVNKIYYQSSPFSWIGSLNIEICTVNLAYFLIGSSEQ